MELGPWRLVHWWLIVAVAAAAGWVQFAGQHRRHWADHELAWWMFHWVTGGRLEPGKSMPVDSGAAARVLRRAVVGAARTVLAAAVVAGEYVRSGAPRGTNPGAVAAAGMAGLATLAAATWLIVYITVQAAHYLQWVRPLHRAAWKPAGWNEEKRPLSYLTVPRNRAEGCVGPLGRRVKRALKRPTDGGVVIKVAPNFDWSDAHVKTLTNLVVGKLDLEGMSITPVPHGRHNYIQFRPQATMPERAMFTDPKIRKLVEEESTPSKPIIGVTRGGKPVAVDLDTESPHVLLSAGTGGGKSSTIRTIAAQLMWHGADVIVIDVKRHSHRWVRGLDGVTYARDISEIHRVLVELGRLGHDRNRSWDDVELGERGPMFTRKVIVCEEMNATMSVLRQWWKDTREPGDPLTSPAVIALGQILFMGRFVRIHVLGIAQMATAKDMGGPEMRENYAVRILARYTANAAKMLVPECALPPSTRHAGRAQVCIGGTATETQVIFMEDRDARGWVDARRNPAGLPAGSSATAPQRDSELVSQGKQAVAATATPEPVALDPSPADELISLREAVEGKVIPLSLSAIRSRRARDPEFPKPVGKDGQSDLFPREALRRWGVNTPAGVLPGDTDYERNETDEVGRMEAGTRA